MLVMYDIDPEINKNKKLNTKIERKLLQEKIMNRSLRLGLADNNELLKFQKSAKSGFNKLIA